MIFSKNSIHSGFAFALLPFLTLGCLSIAAQNTVRVDAGMTQVYEMSDSRTGAIQKWVLPERRSINRIEIYFDPIEPLKNVTVYARMGEDNWRIIKEIKIPIRKSPYIIQTPVFTDAIRVVLSSTSGTIDRIALYGTAAKVASE